MREQNCEDESFRGYEEIQIAGLKLHVKEAEWKHEKHNLYVLGHSDLTYISLRTTWDPPFITFNRASEKLTCLGTRVNPCPSS